MLEGLSHFLVEHERCGEGFDISHPAGLGSGRVSITCRGCGARHEYATTTYEVEREIRIEPLEAQPEPGADVRPPPPERSSRDEPRPHPSADPTPVADPTPEVEPPPAVDPPAAVEWAPTERQLQWGGVRRVEIPPLIDGDGADFPPGWSVPSRPGPPRGRFLRLR